MINAPKQTLLKPSPESEETASTPSAANDLSEADVQTLHEGLTALREEDAQSADENERKSPRALIAYAACDLGVNEEVVRSQVERHFELSDISELQDSRYDELVRFLEEMDVKQFIN